MKYRLGVDIGIASIGWCIMEHDENDNPCRIVDLGVRIFEPAEKPKTGESPAVDRRNARGIRRNIRRRRQRLDKLAFFLETELLGGNKILFTPDDVYELRAKALDERISDNNLARVLYTIAKHRGFKSNRRCEISSDKKATKLVETFEKTSKESKNYRTVGEMYVKNERFFEIKQKIDKGEIKDYVVHNIRNRDGGSEKTLLRADVLQEVKEILTKQKALGNEKIDDRFVEKVIHIIDYQKSYDEGPDFPSPYHVTFNVGVCGFLKGEKRAPKSSFTQEYFTALCDINNLRIDGEFLSDDQRQILINAFLKNSEIKVSSVRKLLKLDDKVRLTGKGGIDKDNFVLLKRKSSYEILKKLGFEQNPKKYENLLNDIALILSMCKSDERRLEQFEKLGTTKPLTEEQKQGLCELDFSKFGNLSIKALKMLISFLEKGQKYQEACVSAGLINDFGDKTFKLKPSKLVELQDLTSPVVKRAVSQTIKLTNAVIDKYGSPCAIFIELGRDMSRDFSERKKIEKEISENFDKNERIKGELKELGISNPKGLDIVKKKLYEEQGGKCVYCGLSFLDRFGDMASIFSNNNTQVDHIIPYSKCYDDSYSNKVLVFSDENSKKGNRIPYEYFGNDQKRWEEFVGRVMSNSNLSKKKVSNLLRTSLTKNQEQELNERALNDTRYICKFMKNLFENHLKFADSTFNKKPVRTVNGAMTSFLRKVWGLPKERFADDKHHAVDAAIVACTDNGMVQRVSLFLQTTQCRKRDNDFQFVDIATGEILNVEDTVKRFGTNFQMPYELFKAELELRISDHVLQRKDELMRIGYSSEEIDNVKPLYVSRMVNHKVTGAIHKDTIRSKKLLDESANKLIVVTKTNLKDLKLDKHGEIEDYPEKFKNDDRKLYDALKKRLKEFGGDAKQAFKEPFYKPAKNPNSRNLVKSVKLQKIINDYVEVNSGVAENGSMIRIDIFEKKGKFHFIPVYVKDYYNKSLPSKICKGAKKLADWPELDDSYIFLFSLYSNDLLKIQSKEGINFIPRDKKAKKEVVVLNDLFVYYKGANRANATMRIETIDGKYMVESVGIQNLLKFEKYEIDILGNIRKVTKEKRKEFK